MREILFRGKRVDDGEWGYGDLIQNDDCMKIREQEKEVKAVAKSCAVIPETVGQYTGLTDKDDRRVFGRDKALFLGQECVVVFEQGAFGIAVKDSFEYNIIHENAERVTGRPFNGCFNDNFISLWELSWNFDCEERKIDVLEVIGTVWDKE